MLLLLIITVEDWKKNVHVIKDHSGLGDLRFTGDDEIFAVVAIFCRVIQIARRVQ